MMEEMSDGAAAIKHGKNKKNSVMTEKETRDVLVCKNCDRSCVITAD